MKKAKTLKAFFICLVIVCITNASLLFVNASSTLEASPHAKIEYGYAAGVSTGTIRYISQVPTYSYYNSAYWGSRWENQARSECLTACMSMALSYVGVNKTPQNILDAGDGLTYPGWKWGNASSLSPAFDTAISNYINGSGKYSPVIIWLPYTSGNHWVLVVGRISGNTYLVADPWNGSHGTTWQATISGNTISYWNGSQSFGRIYQYYNPTAPSLNGNDPLSISNVQISNVTSDSYTVSCNVTGNVTRVLFPTWPSVDDSGNPIWHEGTISGNTASCTIRKSDHGNKEGTYISHIYVYDASGKSVSAAAPEVQLVKFDSCLDYPTANSSYTDSVYVAGWVKVPDGCTNVTGWCNGITFDLPLFDRSDVPNGKGFCAYIPETYMKNGTNSLDIYAYHGTTPYHIKNIDFTYKDTKNPTISDVKIINITENSYTVTCKATDNVKVTSAYFPTWPSIGSSADPVWHSGTINGDTVSCVIKMSDHENKTGTYISHIYVYDDAGNYASFAAPAVELGKKHQHDYTSTIKKPATCTEPGIMLYTCKDNDDSYEEEIPATGHQHTELRNEKEPTCAQEGYTGDTYCTDCGTKLSSGKVLEKKPHTWDDGTITTEATCTEKGVRTYTCTVCNETKTEEIPATGHRHPEERNIKAATCAQEGYTGDMYCKDCNTKLSSGRVLEKKPHTWDSGKITKEATCSEKGIKTYTCVKCNAIKQERLPETGHRNTEYRNIKPATCAEAGYTGDLYCKDCNMMLRNGEKIEKKPHTWNDGTITTEATCTEKGIKTYTCTVCNATKTEEIPATGHQHTELRNVKESTCVQEGYTGDTYCTDCGTKLSSGKSISKTDHTWDAGKVTKNATCIVKGIKTFTCTVCEATRTEEIPVTGHENKITKFVKKASCKSEGYTGDIYCQDCGQLLEEGDVIAKLEHSWDAGSITKQPTTTEEGIKTYTCSNCGVTKTETIAKLKPQKATAGKTIKDQASNGIYKVLNDGLSVEFTKPLSKKASVRIPDTIKVDGITCKVTGIAANAFKNNTSLKNVTIGKNVTTIGANAFYGCKKLTKVSGGNSVAKFGDRAFANCGNLGSITIPGSARSIGKQAFYNCKKLRSITIKTGTLSGKTIGSKAFAGTYKKPTVKVPAKQMKAYKKLLTSKGMNSKAVYKK